MPRLEAHGFRDDPTESLQPHDVVELFAVRGGTRRKQHRVLKRDSAEIDLETTVALSGPSDPAHRLAALVRRW